MSDEDTKHDWLGATRWQSRTSASSTHIRTDIVKGKYRPKKPKRSFKALMDDPLDVQYSTGYKELANGINFALLKNVAGSLSFISAIINTRLNQVSSFSSPYRLTKSLGYVIKHKNPARLTTKGEREMIQDLERFIHNCGSDKENHHAQGLPRDDFETFLRKATRDSLILDQLTAEIVPDHRGYPFEFRAVDASTIRLASPEFEFDYKEWASRPNFEHGAHKFDRFDYDIPDSKDAAFVQVFQDQIERVFTRDEMIFGVRNPRTDLYVQGYGYSEIEMMLKIITHMINAEDYNGKFFQHGSSPKGIINITGDLMDEDFLEDFRRKWKANVEGVSNSWSTPIVQTEQALEWINLNTSNKDMEYGQWMEFLIKIASAVYNIDPAEVNFDVSGGVQNTPLFESSSEWKLKASRDKGLKPLLRFLAKTINTNIISKIDDNFVFDFVGLDELTEKEKHELRKEQVATYKTLNEIRREDDLPEVDGGDVPLNPTYLQAIQVKHQMELEDQQAGAAGGADQAQGQATPQEQNVDGEDNETPAYADQFVKSITEGDFDEWMGIYPSFKV